MRQFGKSQAFNISGHACVSREAGLLDQNYFVLDLLECFLDKSKCHFTLLPGKFKAVNSKYKSHLTEISDSTVEKKTVLVGGGTFIGKLLQSTISAKASFRGYVMKAKNKWSRLQER